MRAPERADVGFVPDFEENLPALVARGGGGGETGEALPPRRGDHALDARLRLEELVAAEERHDDGEPELLGTRHLLVVVREDVDALDLLDGVPIHPFPDDAESHRVGFPQPFARPVGAVLELHAHHLGDGRLGQRVGAGGPGGPEGDGHDGPAGQVGKVGGEFAHEGGSPRLGVRLFFDSTTQSIEIMYILYSSDPSLSRQNRKDPATKKIFIFIFFSLDTGGWVCVI